MAKVNVSLDLSMFVEDTDSECLNITACEENACASAALTLEEARSLYEQLDALMACAEGV